MGHPSRIVLKEGKRVAFQTVNIPVIGLSDRADESGVLFACDSNRMLTCDGTVADTASISLSYDSSGDSLSVHFILR